MVTFPILEGLRPVCSQNVLGADGRELFWELFESDEAPEVLAQRYEAALGKAPVREEGMWRWRDAEDKPRTVLTIHPRTGSYPRCAKEPQGQSVVVRSELRR